MDSLYCSTQTDGPLHGPRSLFISFIFLSRSLSHTHPSTSIFGRTLMGIMYYPAPYPYPNHPNKPPDPHPDPDPTLKPSLRPQKSV